MPKGARRIRKPDVKRIKKALLTTPKARKLILPYERGRYPISHAGPTPRAPHHFWPGWELTYKRVLAVLPKDLRTQLERIPGSEAFVMQTLEKLGIEGYDWEWKGLDPKVIHGIQQVSTPKPNEPEPPVYRANQLVGKMASDVIKERLQAQKNVVIADFGCGAGGTILPTIEKIPKDKRKNLTVILIDVFGEGPRRAATELQKLGVGRVYVVEGNFASETIFRNRTVREFMGKVDVVVSGAALHHTPRIDLVANLIYRMLKPGGEFRGFDWGHALMKGKTLRVAPKGAKVDPNGRYYEINGKRVVAKEGEAFLSQDALVLRGKRIAPSELETVEAMGVAWLRLMGYSELAEKWREYVKARVSRNEGINFVEFLTSLPKEPTKGKMPFWWIEGHEPEHRYRIDFQRAGLREVSIWFPFLSEERKGTPEIYSLLYCIKAKKPVPREK